MRNKEVKLVTLSGLTRFFVASEATAKPRQDSINAGPAFKKENSIASDGFGNSQVENAIFIIPVELIS